MDTMKVIESIIRGLMFLAGILGNSWLVIRSLPGHKTVIRTNEVLFINLAFSNLITNCLVDLPDTIADFAGRWFLGETFCGVFRFCAELSETSSIFTTFFISVFWHQKLVGSLKRGGGAVRLDSLRPVGCLLAGSWTVAVIFSVPHFFFVVVEAGNESKEDCLEVFPNPVAQQAYEITYLTVANAFPVAGIVFASVQIVITLLQNQRRIQSHNSDQTKEASKEGSESVESRNEDTSVSAVSASEDLKESHVYTGVAASSCPDAPPRSALGRETGSDRRAGAQPTLSGPSQMPSKPSPNSGPQVRAAKSVVAVASVVLVCWLTHLLLRITNNIHTSSIVLEVASYIAASYTCIIPYIFLHGVKKLSCSCKR